MDLAFAWYVPNKSICTLDTNFYRNFEKILLGAYRWLAENYKIGDRIYLYGEKVPSFQYFRQM